MLPGAISTVTASGTGTGFLPIRLIDSPDVGDDLAADALGAGFVAGHHTNRGADDCGPGSTLHARDVFVVDVATPAGARDPFDPQDDRTPVLGVLEGDVDRLADCGRLAVEVLDVALLLEDPRHLHLQAGEGDLHLVVAGADGVADAGQIIGNWIGQHRLVLPARLGHAGDIPLVGSLAQADPAEAELAVVRPWAPTAATAVVVTRFVLGFAALTDLLRSLSHSL